MLYKWVISKSRADFQHLNFCSHSHRFYLNTVLPLSLKLLLTRQLGKTDCRLSKLRLMVVYEEPLDGL